MQKCAFLPTFHYTTFCIYRQERTVWIQISHFPWKAWDTESLGHGQVCLARDKKQEALKATSTWQGVSTSDCRSQVVEMEVKLTEFLQVARQAVSLFKESKDQQGEASGKLVSIRVLPMVTCFAQPGSCRGGGGAWMLGSQKRQRGTASGQ